MARKVRILMLFAVLVLPAWQLVGQTPTPTGPLSNSEIEKLINLLGDESFTRRDSADRQLSQMGDEVLPVLRAAMTNNNLEIRRRAESIYRRLTDLSADRRFAISFAANSAFANG